MERKDGQSKEMIAAVENYQNALKKALVSHAISPEELEKIGWSATLTLVLQRRAFADTQTSVSDKKPRSLTAIPIGHDLNALLTADNNPDLLQIYSLFADANMLLINKSVEEVVGDLTLNRERPAYHFHIGKAKMLFPDRMRNDEISPGVINDLSRLLEFVSNHPDSEITMRKRGT